MFRNARCRGTGRRRGFISIAEFARIYHSKEFMSTLSSEQWRAIIPYLDQMLALTVEERVAWLSSLAEQNPTLVAQLRSLLDEQRASVQEGFLEQSPVPLPLAPGLAGQGVGAYTLLSQIGQGGMGSVWLAERSDGR